MFKTNLLSQLFKSGLSVGAAIAVVVLSLIATIAVYILIMPERKRPRMSGFAAALHDIFQFKSFLIEKIVKFLYVFSTIYIIFSGFFTLFKSFGTGLLTMLLGPIVLRLVYEFFMLTILLVKNVIEINRKLGGEPAAPRASSVRRPAASRPEPSRQAAARATADTKTCPSCGKQIPKTAGFCKYCGSKIETEEDTRNAPAVDGVKGDASRPASWELPEDFI